MKRILIPAVLAALAVSVSSAGAAPGPFPAPQLKMLFVAAQVVTPNGTVASWFKPGSTAIFRAYAVDGKSQKMIAQKDVKFFYVTIPGAPNVKLTYNPKAPGASTGIPWTGTWTIPANYPAGLVPFNVHVKLNSRRTGSFAQVPVATSQLNVSLTAPEPIGQGGQAGSLVTGKAKPTLALYVDSVNGTAPAGTQARPIGCTQTNVYRRGERMVVRAWGTDLKTTDVLTNDNVKEAHFAIAGQPNVPLSFGTHGQVQFWAAYWIVPADYPLGETIVHVTFTTLDGKTATFDYPINVIP